jgi:hypothetical protein
MSMEDDLSEIIMVDLIQLTLNDMFRWVIVERRIGIITFWGVFPNLKVLRCLFVGVAVSFAPLVEVVLQLLVGACPIFYSYGYVGVV